MLELKVKDTQNNILDSLSEVLLLTYGTKAYHQVLSAIKKAIRNIEQQHKTAQYWQ